MNIRWYAIPYNVRYKDSFSPYFSCETLSSNVTSRCQRQQCLISCSHRPGGKSTVHPPTATPKDQRLDQGNKAFQCTCARVNVPRAHYMGGGGTAIRIEAWQGLAVSRLTVNRRVNTWWQMQQKQGQRVLVRAI